MEIMRWVFTENTTEMAKIQPHISKFSQCYIIKYSSAWMKPQAFACLVGMTSYLNRDINKITLAYIIIYIEEILLYLISWYFTVFFLKPVFNQITGVVYLKRIRQSFALPLWITTGRVMHNRMRNAKIIEWDDFIKRKICSSYHPWL